MSRVHFVSSNGTGIQFVPFDVANSGHSHVLVCVCSFEVFNCDSSKTFSRLGTESKTWKERSRSAYDVTMIAISRQRLERIYCPAGTPEPREKPEQTKC